MAYTPNPLYYVEPEPAAAAPTAAPEAAPAPAATLSYTPNPLYYVSPGDAANAPSDSASVSGEQQPPATKPMAPQGQPVSSDPRSSGGSTNVSSQQSSASPAVPVQSSQPVSSSGATEAVVKAPLTAPSQTAVPHDPFSWVQDTWNQLTRTENSLEKAGVVLDLQSAPSLSTRNRYGQRGRDVALGGTGTETLGTSNPLDIIAHPETASNLLYQPGMDALTLSGDYDQFMRDNAEELNALYEQTGDIGIYYDKYLEHQKATLETGGIGGALRGMGQTMLGDPSVGPSLLLNAGVGVGAKALQAAGQVGLARGLVGATNVANAAVDITDPMLSGAAGVLSRAAPKLFGWGTRTSNRVGAERVSEAVGTAQQELVANRGVTPPPPMGAPATYAPSPVAPLPLPAGGTSSGSVAGGTSSVYPSPIPLGPPTASSPTPPNSAIPSLSTPPATSGSGSGTGSAQAAPPDPGVSAPDQTVPTPAQPLPPTQGAQPQPPTPTTPTSRFSPAPSALRDILMMPRPDGRGFDYVWNDGEFTPLGPRDFDVAMPSMRSVDPADLHPTQGGPGATFWTKMRSAMTSTGYMVDDWPTNKQLLFAHLPDTPAKKEAYGRWLDLTSARITQFQEREVQRMLDNFQTESIRRQARRNEAMDQGYPVSRNDSVEMDTVDAANRADAIVEALRKANFERSVLLDVNGNSVSYQPPVGTRAEGSVMRGRVYGIIKTHAAPEGGAISTPPHGAHLSDGTFHLNIPPSADDLRVADSSFLTDTQRDIFLRMIHDPDGFGVSMREAEELLSSGAISPERARQIAEYSRLRRSLYAKKTPDGKEQVWVQSTPNLRYNESYAHWEKLGGSLPKQRAFNPPDIDEDLAVTDADGGLDGYEGGNEAAAWQDEGWYDAYYHVGQNRIGDALRQNATDRLWQNAKWDELTREFEGALRQMGLSDVQFAFVPDMNDAGKNIRGGHFAQKKLILLSMQPPRFWETLSDLPEDAVRRVFNHEVMHAVRAAGFLTSDQWQVLVNAATKAGLRHADSFSPFSGIRKGAAGAYDRIKEGYEKSGIYSKVKNPEDKYEEEAVSELFAYYVTGKSIPNEAKSVFDRLISYLRGIGEKLRGTNAERIMDSILSGEAGARGRRSPTVSMTERTTGLYNSPQTVAPFLSSLFNKSDLDRMALDAADDTEFGGVPIGLGTRTVFKLADKHHLSDWKGRKVTLWELLNDVQHDLDQAGVLIAQKNAGWAGHNPKSQKAGEKELNRIVKQYADDIEEPLDSLTGDSMTRAVTNKVTAVWAKGLPDDGAAARGVSGEVRSALRNFVNFRRVAGLTNLAAGPRQIITQYFGNMVAFAIGKPGAALQYVNPRAFGEIVRAGEDAANVGTDFADEMRDFGLGRNLGIWNHRNSLAGHETEVHGLLGGVLNIVAPKWMRNLVGASDVMARDIAARTSWRTGIQREIQALPARSRALAQTYATSRGGNFGAVVNTIADDMPGIIERLRRPGHGYARFNGSQLEQAILDHYDALGHIRTGVVDRDVLLSYAKRMARDWNTVINTEYQKAAKEVNRTFFSWDNNRVDDVVQNIFLYHYWATRASGMYAKEFAKKPWMAAGFIELSKQLQAEAEQGDYPQWMQQWTRVMNSPTGLALWVSPMDMLYTAVLHAEWGALQNGTDPGKELTEIGRIRDQGLIPFAWNPLLEFGMWLGNAFGADAFAPVNMTGLDKLTGLGAQIMNQLLYAGLLPDGMGKDEFGNPIPFSPRPFTDIVHAIGAHVGQYSPSQYGSFEANKKGALIELIAMDQPGITIHDALTVANEMVEEAKTGAADPMILEAERMALSAGTAGPEMPFVPDALRPFFGQAARLISPFRMYGKVEQTALIQNPKLSNVLPGSPQALSQTMPASDLYERKDMKNALYDTPIAANLEQAENEYWDGGNPELAALSTDYWAIVNGEMPKVKIGSRTYSGESLEARKEGDHYYNLANEWLESKGYSESDMEALQAERDRITSENPLLAEYMSYKDFIGQYPGGPQAFVDAAVKSSPAFAEFMRQVPYPEGTPDYYGAADWSDAFFAIRGDRSSVYDPQQLPATGSIPGVGGGMGAVQLANEQIAQAAETESGFDEFKATVEDEVANIARGQEVINRLYPGSGLVVGQYFDYEIYQTLKAAWQAEGIYVPSIEDSPVAYEYFDWLKQNATTTDGGVEAFLEQRDYAGKGKEVTLPTPTEIGDIFSFGVSERPVASAGAGSPSMAHRATTVQSRDALPLYTGPSGNNPTLMTIPPGLGMQLIEQQDGYAYVRIPFPAPNGTTGWVPESYLFVVQ